jgi:hypothetical protein
MVGAIVPIASQASLYDAPHPRLSVFRQESHQVQLRLGRILRHQEWVQDSVIG